MKVISIVERTLSEMSFDEWAESLVKSSKEFDPTSPLTMTHMEALKRDGTCKVEERFKGEKLTVQYFLLEDGDGKEEAIKEKIKEKTKA